MKAVEYSQEKSKTLMIKFSLLLKNLESFNGSQKIQKHLIVAKIQKHLIVAKNSKAFNCCKNSKAFNRSQKQKY